MADTLHHKEKSLHAGDCGARSLYLGAGAEMLFFFLWVILLLEIYFH